MTKEVKTRLLVADDDPLIRTIMSSKLVDFGYDVELVTSGVGAMNKLSASRFDLLLSDLDMPSMNGYELTKTIRATPDIAALPIIVVTGVQDTEACERAFRIGADSFIAKPINWAMLVHQIRFVLRAAERERMLRAAEAEARQANRRKDAMLSTVSHALRTPLHAIAGFANLLKEETEGPVGGDIYRDYVNEIVRASRQLGDLLDDATAANRIISGTGKSTPAKYCLDEIIAPAVGRLGPFAAEKGVTVAIDITPDMPAIVCDIEALQLVLRHLVRNAIVHGPQSGRVTITAQPQDDGSAITIHDEGTGFEAAKPHSQGADNPDDDCVLIRAKDGLGVGLSVVCHVMALQGGQVDFERDPETGFAVRLTIPDRTDCATEERNVA